MNRQVREFLLWENASRDTVDFKKCYVDLADDLVAGLLLSQIVYWHLPSKETGKTKLRVRQEGHLWIAKGREDWHEEIRITAKQFDRASNILVKKGLIEKKTFKFNGNPTIHIRLIWENFLPSLEALIYGEDDNENEDENELEAMSDMVIPQRGKRNLPKGEKRSSPKVNNDITERSISLTKSTTENTNKELKDIVNKENLVSNENINNIENSSEDDIIHNLTNEYRSKGLSKEVCLRVVQEVLEKKDIRNFGAYLRICLEGALHKSEVKRGIKDPAEKLKQLTENQDVPFYNWLEN